MATLKAGDLAALISGSPRMAVESVEGDNVSLVWCNEGVIYRDTFDKILQTNRKECFKQKTVLLTNY